MSLRHRRVLSSRIEATSRQTERVSTYTELPVPAVVSSFSACTSCQRQNVFRSISRFDSSLSTTTLTGTPSHIDRRRIMPTERHRCRRERPSSSTTVVIPSYPVSFMAKSRVYHLIHDYIDVHILSRLSRVCVDCERRIDRTTRDRCRLSCQELQSSPPLRLRLMPTSKCRPLHLTLWLHHHHHDT